MSSPASHEIPDHPPTDWRRDRRFPHWASGAIGGLAVAAVATVLVATGAVGDAGHERVRGRR
jgi:hypothetical protein